MPVWSTVYPVTAKACEDYDQTLADHLTTNETAPSAPALPVQLVQALPEIMRSLELDPARMLRDAGLDPGLFAGAEQCITFPELERLLLECERQAACDHIGLLLGQTLRLDDLGLAGRVVRCRPTAGDGLREFVAISNLYDTPAMAQFEVSGERARFAWTLNEHCLVDARHFDYAGMAASRNALHELFGSNWRPTLVRFASRHPIDVRVFQSVFHAPLEFDAGRSEIEFDAHWLQQPLPALEPATHTAIVDELQQARLDALTDLPATLRRILRKRLLLGDFSMDDVAAQLSMHRRTLDRRLQRSSTTYGELLEAVRDEIARHLLRETQFSIQRVAEAVRFSSAANFATAFRRRIGMTPTEYRRSAS